MTKPFLLIQTRPEDVVSDDEYRSFYTFGGLAPDQLVRVRLDKGEFPDINLDDYSGVIHGGGPACFAYPDEKKSEVQRAFEPWLFEMMRRIIAEDKPFLGACLGFGTVVQQIGGQMSFDHSEETGAVEVVVTEHGQMDPLLEDMPEVFNAFVGHKEGIYVTPPHAVELARSSKCVQMIRVGKNVYGTQFHPELDEAGLVLRVQIYRNAGYFPPESADTLIANAWRSNVTVAVDILKKFVDRYAV
jgi:GMP synthase (glutamine-hydrolysing)